MSTQPHKMRCRRCGKWTRRSACSVCRAELKREALIENPGRLQRQAERQWKASRSR